MKISLKNFTIVIFLYFVLASSNINQIIYNHFIGESYENQMAY